MGLKHFLFLFSFSDFYNILRNTVLINLYNLVFGFPVPIILALMLNELRSLRFKKCIQTVVYFPHFLSWVIFGGLPIQFLSPNEGFINKINRIHGRRADPPQGCDGMLILDRDGRVLSASDERFRPNTGKPNGRTKPGRDKGLPIRQKRQAA